MILINRKTPIKRKENCIPVILSGVIHLVILLMIGLTTPSLPKIISKEKQSIKSYLYKAPLNKGAIIEKIEVRQAQKTDVVEVIVKKNESNKDQISKLVAKNSASVNKVTTLANTAAAKISKQAKESPKEHIHFSADEQLKNLRQSLNNKMIKQELTELQRLKSVSVMHAKPTLVPRSFTKTVVDGVPEGAKETQMSTTYYGNTSVYKDENGKCTEITDMSFLGAGPMKQRISYQCGESKIDKKFRLHMKNVLKNLGK